MSETLEVRRRRARYRAHHRGTKELDILIGRFCDAKLEAFDDAQLARFEGFLAVADPKLQSWLFGHAAVDERAFAGLVTEIRAFHGLDQSGVERDEGGDGTTR